MVVGDLPFLSYQVSVEDGVRNAGRFLKEGGAQAVKLEGAHLDLVHRLVDVGIPVMAHVGLTPQSVHAMGGYRVQGRGEAAHVVLEQAAQLEKAGAFSIVLEAMPADLAGEITRSLEIPTIGIGAGPDCDAQVLVIHDLLGINDRVPKLSKKYADLREGSPEAVRRDVHRRGRRGDVPRRGAPTPTEPAGGPAYTRRVARGMAGADDPTARDQGGARREAHARAPWAGLDAPRTRRDHPGALRRAGRRGASRVPRADPPGGGPPRAGRRRGGPRAQARRRRRDGSTVGPQDVAAVVREAVEKQDLGAHPLEIDAEDRRDGHGGRRAAGHRGRELARNAAAYSPPDAPIAVRVRRDGADVTIEVIDRGPGIPPEQHDAVFERFARWRPAGYEDRPGSGLGLSIARRSPGRTRWRRFDRRRDDRGYDAHRPTSCGGVKGGLA